MSLFVFAALLPIVGAAAPRAVGEKAPDFTLSTPEGKHIRLSDVTSMGPVVLVVLRGYPVTNVRIATGRFRISCKTQRRSPMPAPAW